MRDTRAVDRVDAKRLESNSQRFVGTVHAALRFAGRAGIALWNASRAISGVVIMPILTAKAYSEESWG